MKVGIIWVGHQCEDLMERSLAPWIAARATKLGGHDFTICAVSVPFEGFPQESEPDRTRTLLGFASTDNQIDHAIVRDKVMKETEARGAALRWLVDKGVDVLVQVDADERYLPTQIEAIMRWVEANPYVDWFRLALRNLVFTVTQYLAEPFTPPRIHRVRVRGYQVHSFHEDNGITYGGTITRDLLPDSQFSSMTIPKEVAWVEHETWLSDERSRRKVAYQIARWHHCSFRWDDVANELRFDEAFYAARGLPLPEVLRTDSV